VRALHPCQGIRPGRYSRLRALEAPLADRPHVQCLSDGSPPRTLAELGRDAKVVGAWLQSLGGLYWDGIWVTHRREQFEKVTQGPVGKVLAPGRRGKVPPPAGAAG